MKAFRRACCLFVFLHALPITAVNADVGPCNEDYSFVCDSENKCTCVKRGNLGGLRLVILDEPLNIPVGPGETLELMASFGPDQESECLITFDVRLQSLDGRLLDQSSANLDVASPFSIYEHKFFPVGIKPSYANIRFSGDAENCSLQEITSFRPAIVTYHGKSGKITYRSSLKYRYEFQLDPGELPPLLPPVNPLGKCDKL